MQTTSPLYKKSSFSVLRRYSDFLWLYETLSMNNPGVVVPPVPDKNTFGRFAEDFVQQRIYVTAVSVAGFTYEVRATFSFVLDIKLTGVRWRRPFSHVKFIII